MYKETSYLQRYIWIDQKLNQNSPKYNIGGYAILNEKIDVNSFKGAIDSIVNNNEIFSFSFKEIEGIPSYNIQETVNYQIDFIDCDSEEQAISQMEADFSVPFDMTADEFLCKFWLIKISEDKYFWYTKLHHILGDGFSFQLLFNQFTTSYNSVISGNEAVPTSVFKYTAFIEEEKEYRDSAHFKRDLDFWKQKFSHEPLLIFQKRNDNKGHYHKEIDIDTDSVRILKKKADVNGVSIFHLLLSTFSMILSKYYRQEEVSIGVPILNRGKADYKKTFGPFMSVIPLQFQIDAKSEFKELFHETKREVYNCYRHQKVQQAGILRYIDHDIQRLYDVRISYENPEFNKDINSSILALSNDSEEDPISIHIMDYKDEPLRIRFDINENYVPKHEALQLISSFKFLLENIDELVNKPITAISIIDAQQRQEVVKLSTGNIKKRDGATFMSAWEKSVLNAGKEIAVISGPNEFTYSEVNLKANHLVDILQRKGVQKGDKVVVVLDNSERAIISILALFKIGAVYVPIDKNSPHEKKTFIINDSEAVLAITGDENDQLGIDQLDIRELENIKSESSFNKSEISPFDIAYIIYTSGSTGNPKGVLISHQSLLDYILTFVDYFELTSSDKVLQQSSLAFDTSVEEIFPILSIGGSLIMASDSKDFNRLLKECEEYQITVLSTNPYMIQYLDQFEDKFNLKLRVIISGGDVLKADYISNLVGKYQLYNTYGPTESTVCATYHKIEKLSSPVPIGRPITNRGTFIIDDEQLLPIGAIGEICLSGEGLAVGYLNLEELTKTAFTSINGTRCYRTGDLGKWDELGNLIFIGRKDDQLSYRGYRIEQEEIEVAIKSLFNYVEDCFICVKELHEQPVLVAYITGKADNIDSAKIRTQLATKLPPHMIPTSYVELSELPKLSNGKIDKKRLPLPEIKRTSSNEIIAPTTPAEKEIEAIWKSLLKLETIDIHTSFFELGGHSLMANQFISLIRDQKDLEISLKDFYQNSTIAAVGVLMSSVSKSNEVIKLTQAPENTLIPLSYSQERLWFLNQLDSDNSSYNVARAIKITGEVQKNHVENSFQQLIYKHEILRTSFPVIEGVPYQHVSEDYDFKVAHLSYKDLSKEEQEQAVGNFISREGNLHFDIERGLLLRVTLIELEDDVNILVFCEHHLLHDGWSQGILLREFIDTYSKLTEDPEYKLIKPEIQFKDYAYWQKQYMSEERLEERLDFWSKKLKGANNKLALPLDRKRPKQITGNGGLIIEVLSEELSQQLRTWSSSNGSTLFITMLTAFKIMLSKFSNETDISVGTGIADRKLKELNGMLGMIINTLVLRTEFSRNDTLLEIVQKVKDTCFESYAYDDTPFGKVVEKLEPKRELGLTPLFQVFFGFMNTPSRNLEMPNMNLEILDSHNSSSKFDLNIVVVTPFEQAEMEGLSGTDRSITVEWEYNSDIFDLGTMKRMLSTYLNIIQKVIDSPNQLFSSLDYIESVEKKKLLVDFNETSVAYPEDKTIINLFQDQAKSTPNEIAIMFEDQALSYKELNERSNQLASYLRSQYTIKSDDLISIKLERNEQLIITILAVLKSGAAYVPIDPTYPQDRIDYMLSDSESKILIDKTELAKFNAVSKNYGIDNLEQINSPSDLAYVIYTSGSTGKPKGVMIEHRNVMAFISWSREEFKNSDFKITYGVTSVCFDLSIFEIFYTLSAGKKLRILENVLSIPEYLEKDEKVLLNTVPSGIGALIAGGINWSSVNVINMAGEPIPHDYISKLDTERIEVRNLYGPSEDTTYSTMYRIQNDAPISIGKPISNTSAYILDENQQLQPIGVIGEIALSGAGLSRGYLNRKDLTAEKFIKHPFQEGERIYLTGDLGKRLPDGNIEFVGRRDTQVKIRGYRIECGEIESMLGLHADVIAAVVLARENEKQEKTLVAYIVCDKELTTQQVRTYLQGKLPDYMLPSHYVAMDAFPLTPNGKIDKNKLPNPEGMGLSNEVEYIAPRNEIEEKLVVLWEQILEREKIGIKDDFFEQGGHSLKLTRLVSQIHKTFNIRVELKELFGNPILEDQALLISQGEKAEYIAIPLTSHSEGYVLSSSQQRLWILNQLDEESLAYNMPSVYELGGKLDVTSLEASFKALLERHEILRTVFRESALGDIRQYVLSVRNLDFHLEFHDLQKFADQEKKLKELVNQSFSKPFDLGTGPLLRAELYQVAEDRWIFSYVMHHIISDGWSMEILIKELMTNYHGYAIDNHLTLPTLPIQYKEYAQWQQDQLSSGSLSLSGVYWKEQLSGELPTLKLPTDRPRPLVKTYNGDIITHQFDQQISESLKLLVQINGSTLFMGLLGVVNTLLYRYTQQEDIIVGSPIAGRDHADLEDQIGFYVNTLALRTQFDGSAGFDQLLDNIKQQTIEAYKHQMYPFDALIDELDLRRDLSRDALFDVMVILQNVGLHEEDIFYQVGELNIRPYGEDDSKISKFDLTFEFVEGAEGLQLAIEYNTDLFDESTIKRLLVHLEGLMRSIISNPATPLSQLKYQGIDEQELNLLNSFNATYKDYPKDKTIISLFEEQVKATPKKVAIVFEDQELTYQQLNERSNQLANYLTQRYTIEADNLIGIKLVRNEWLVISILAVLKSGGAYVPLDPEYPQDRIDYMLSDSKCQVLIDEALLAKFKAISADHSTINLDQQIQPTDLAYVIYTSGSTGYPKGVMIEHGNVMAFVSWCKDEFEKSNFDITYGVTSVCFDLSIFEIFYTLSVGKKLRILDNALNIPKYLKEDKNILLNTVPSGIRTLLSEPSILDSVNVINMAGEPVPLDFTTKLDTARIEVRNLYGPSEDTTYSTMYHLQHGAPILIGKPISNTTIDIVNDNLELQPIGVMGEIGISGAGLSRGYLNRPELSEEKFIKHPFREGERMYLTGDLGKRLSDGNIEFLGRKDDQVKIRGYRIELGEIENVLELHNDIVSAIVLAKENGDQEKELIAYIVSEQELTTEQIRSYLQERLPSYMMPSHYVSMESFPLTPNGKINKKKLPNPKGMGLSSGITYVAPRTEAEEQLVELWQQVLEKEKIGVKDDFFVHGGHSLKLTRLVGHIHKTFGVRLELKDLFLNPVLEQQVNLIVQANKTEYTAIPLNTQLASFVLSSSQQRLWILSQFENSSIAYNIPSAYELIGNLDIDSLRAGFNSLLDRHEILRTVFKESSEGEINQHVLTLSEADFHLDYHDLRETQNNDEQVKKLVGETFSKPFDLISGPLLRAGLYQMADDRWVFTYVMHHIISDGWSMGVLIKELLTCYDSHNKGTLLALPSLPIQYKDYAIWQQNQLNSEVMAPSKAYWQDQLSGELPTLDLPIDRVRPSVKTYNGSSLTYSIDPRLSREVKALSQVDGGTLFMGLMGMVNTLLYRYTNQEDIIIGSPIAGREHADLEGQIGVYVNTLALRTRFNGNEGFDRLLENIKKDTLEAYKHQMYPFDSLVDELDLRRDLSRHALFDVMILLQNVGLGEYKLSDQVGGLQINPYEVASNQISKFDLTFNFTESNEGLQIRLEYNSDLFDRSTIERIPQHLEGVMRSAVANPKTPLSKIEYVGAAEKELLLNTFNAKEKAYPKDKTIVALIEQQVEKNPDHTAIVCDNKKLTYRQLNDQANQLAHYLSSNHVLQPDDLIAIKLERSESLVISILAVLKTGSAYLPIDPEYPQERIDYLVSDSASKTLIDEVELSKFNAVSANYSTDNLEGISTPKDLAYVIYTSGSTGKPKGVMVEHQALTNLCFWHKNDLNIDETDQSTLYAGVSFDAAVLELFPYLMTGACIHVIPKEARLDMNKLSKFYHDNHISISFLPTKIAEPFLATENKSLRYLLIGGDQITTHNHNEYQVINNYGPTECTVVTCRSKLDKHTQHITIGDPIDNMKVYILDKDKAICPVGITGEICISGAGLARGYLNRPELTAAQFVENPYLPGERMYMSGDLGRWLPDGNIEFLGRIDDQVKIRGYRIELGEIESILDLHEDIETAVVIARENEHLEKELVAYLVCKKELTTQQVRAFLQPQLPTYMLPGHYVPLEALPLTPNGKIDKKQLPNPKNLGMSSTVEYIAPRNETEEQLTILWQQVLEKERVGIKDNFFELGGHSLKLTRLISQIHKTFEVKVELKDLFMNATIEEQAGLIINESKSEYINIPQAKASSEYPLSSAQKRLWVLSQFEEGSKAYNIPSVYELEGNLDKQALKESFKGLLERHEILRTVFKESEHGDVNQYILTFSEMGFELDYQDLRTIDKPEEHVKKLVNASCSEAFNLSIGPLLRAGLYKIAENRWVFSYVMHHIISDGWSMGILIKELLTHYSQHRSGDTLSVPVLPVQYKDYAVWQQDQLTSETLSSSKAYWKERLSGELPILALPTDHARPSLKTYNGASYSHDFSAKISTGFKSILQSNDVTLFMGLLGVVNTLLYRYTQQEDIILGSPIAGRNHADLEEQIGFYVNTLTLRTQLDGSAGFDTLLGNIKQQTLEAFQHQMYPFDALIDELDLHRDMSRNALFDVMVVLQNTLDSEHEALHEVEELKIKAYEGETSRVSKFDLTFVFVEGSTGLQLRLEYNTDLFEESTILRIVAHMESLMKSIVLAPTTPLSQLNYIDKKEEELILNVFNDTQIAYPKDKTIVSLFEEQVISTPEAVAVIFEDQALTYSELNEHSNQLASYLRSNYTIKADDLIGINLERSEWLIISILAVLKSGGAYLPIDPAYPQERIDFMLADSASKIMIDELEIEKFKKESTNYSTETPEQNNTSTDLAYVIYTSGSTGEPKGVMIEQKSVVRLVKSNNYATLNTSTVLLSTGATVFDATTFEYWGTLLNGGKLILCPSHTLLNTALLKEEINKRGVNIMWFTSSWLNQLVDDSIELFAELKTVLTGGERLSSYHIQKLKEHCPELKVVNGYGPTENTTFSTTFEIDSLEGDIPIGKPICNSTAYILDKNQNMMPVGAIGEISLGGDGLARGYLNNPELTTEKFIEHPFRSGERLYRTGDLGRWLSDGNIEFLGREDDQVKIRGYRIELGEIATALEKNDQIESALVINLENANKEMELIAYLIGAEELTSADIRQYLAKILPGYMIPVTYIYINEIPLTTNGKLDKQKLPHPDSLGLSREIEYVAPRNPTEEKLAIMWEDILDKKEVGVKDNFFELGGHSIKATRLTSKIFKEFEVKIDLKDVFMEPTIEVLAEMVDNNLWLKSSVPNTNDQYDQIEI